uniref:Uncharacterized protein n=1 Tax=Acrobeloides nanus TaxID=290746 RepID=A0A914EGE3_9BILA
MVFSGSRKGDEVREAERRMHERMRMYGGTKSSSSARRRQYSRFVEYIFKNVMHTLGFESRCQYRAEMI